ncbi:MAG: carbohydrate kinase family protein [Candidatus Saccharimonadales bacterium]
MTMAYASLPKIIVCGSIAIDRIMNFSGRYKDLIKPDKIHVLSLSIFLDKIVNNHGGVGANICRTLSLFGEKPILLGSVGPDADKYIEKLAESGVNVDYVHRSDTPTACFNVFTDSDDNQVGGFYPGAMSDSESLSFERWKDKNVFMVISPHDPKMMRQQIDECKRFGMRMFYDIGQQVISVPKKDLIAGINTAELLILNDYEFSVLSDRTGMAQKEIFEKVPVVIVTKGKEGSMIGGASVKTVINVPIAKPTVVADPTGAGDSFRAGFLYGYIRGLDLETCGKLGAVSSVYAVETHGTQEFSFTKKGFEKRYAANFHDKVVIK